AYNRETKTGACRRITNHIDFEYCPTPMEHAIVSVINKNQIFSFRVSSSPKSESKKRFQHMVYACGVNKSLKNVALKKVIT
ncbi:unnamed protein product, partial [Brassica oleracea]